MVIVVWSLLVDVPSTCSSLNKCSQSLVDYFSVSFFLQLHFFFDIQFQYVHCCAQCRGEISSHMKYLSHEHELSSQKKSTESLQFQAKSIRSDIKNDISIEASLARSLSCIALCCNRHGHWTCSSRRTSDFERRVQKFL